MSIIIDELRRNHRLCNQKGIAVCFLDFDGVINTYVNGEYQLGVESCMNLVNKLCLTHSLDIVISSSWRDFGLTYCENLLRSYGLNDRIKVIGITINLNTDKRYCEILNYLFEHPCIERFIILDDLSMGPLNSYACKTDYNKGFNLEKFQEAKIKLRKKL